MGYSGAEYERFRTRAEAEAFMVNGAVAAAIKDEKVKDEKVKQERKD